MGPEPDSSRSRTEVRGPLEVMSASEPSAPSRASELRRLRLPAATSPAYAVSPRETASPKFLASLALTTRTAVTASSPDLSTSSSIGVPSPSPLAREATSTTRTTSGAQVCEVIADSVCARNGLAPADTTTARAPTRLAPCVEPAGVILRDA